MNPASFLAEHWREIVFAVIAAIVVAVFWEPIKRLFVSIFRFVSRLSATKRFEHNYREWLISKYKFLNVRGIKTNAPVSVELERVFVSLKARSVSDRTDYQYVAAEPLDSDLGDYLVRDEYYAAAVRTPRWEEDETAKSYELKDLFSLPQRRFIIIGAPGSGKTTLLNYFALKFARKDAKQLFGMKTDALPIFVNLRDVTTQGSLDVKKFADNYRDYIDVPKCPQGFFEKRLEQGTCVLILDGLDEVAKEQERRIVARWVDEMSACYSRNLFIATSRPYGYEATRLYNDFLEFHILDLTPEQVEEFIRYWTKAVEVKARGDDSEFTVREAEKKAEDLLKAVKDSPKIEVLTVNPLLLTIVSLVHRYRATLPKRRVELYEECCDILLGYWDTAKGMASQLQPRQKRTVLQPLAYYLHRNGLREEKRDKVVELLKGELPKIGVSEDKAGELLEDVRHRCGMLVETKLGYFGFAHLTFQEFLTARHILDNDLEDFLVARRRDKYWLEVTLLYCGMKDTSSLLRRILHEKEDIFYTNLFAAGRCLAESLSVKPEIRTDINHTLLRICWDESEFELLKGTSWGILRESKDPRTIGDLVDKTRDKESDVRGRAADALGQIQAKEAAPALIQLLTDKRSSVRWRAASALGDMQAEAAVRPLIELLSDEHPGVRARATSALGRLQAREATKPLIELLSDKKAHVRARAACALGLIRAEDAITPLIDLLKDQEGHVKAGAAYALGELRARQALFLLVELLKDTQPRVRDNAAWSLGKISGEEVVLPIIGTLKDKKTDTSRGVALALCKLDLRDPIAPLTELLKHPRCRVRGRAAYVLGELQAKEAASSLMVLLKDNEGLVRAKVAHSLGRIRAYEATQRLVELLKDDRSQVRANAAYALGRIRAKEAIEPLVRLLKDKNGYVKSYAAYALGEAGATEAAPHLIELMKDRDRYVRERAARALGQMQVREAAMPLIQLLGDSQAGVRRTSAYALARIGAKEAVPSLAELLRDKEAFVSNSAVYALGSIADINSVDLLRPLLDDPTFYVRQSAFRALELISQRSGAPIYPD